MAEPRGNHPGPCNEWCREHGCTKSVKSTEIGGLRNLVESMGTRAAPFWDDHQRHIEAHREFITGEHIHQRYKDLLQRLRDPGPVEPETYVMPPSYMRHRNDQR